MRSGLHSGENGPQQPARPGEIATRKAPQFLCEGALGVALCLSVARTIRSRASAFFGSSGLEEGTEMAVIDDLGNLPGAVIVNA